MKYIIHNITMTDPWSFGAKNIFPTHVGTAASGLPRLSRQDPSISFKSVHDGVCCKHVKDPSIQPTKFWVTRSEFTLENGFSRRKSNW